ncbi:alternative oxidase [Legionella bozemanae]|uniref:alternative oxidase n=1 Tax=Legionella bozemanae TaxID=447 RepID=UPI00399D54FE
MTYRIVGYLEEESVISYIYYLQELYESHSENSLVPDIVESYWRGGLALGAQLRDVLLAESNAMQQNTEV